MHTMDNRPMNGRKRRPWLNGGLAAVALAVLALSAATHGQEQDAAGIDDTRAALEQWVETRRIISKEKRDWALGKEVLNDRIEIVETEVKSLRDKINTAEQSIAEAEGKRAALEQDNNKLKQASSSLGSTILALEKRTKELLPRLPEPVRLRVKPLSQRIPENPQETKQSLAERFQNVVGVLNEVNKFNSQITINTEIRELPNGTSSEVTTLYVGLGHAYYANANATLAGIGTATASGWVWTPANEHAEKIAKAIAIWNNDEIAEYVQLSVEVE